MTNDSLILKQMRMESKSHQENDHNFEKESHQEKGNLNLIKRKIIILKKSLTKRKIFK